MILLNRKEKVWFGKIYEKGCDIMSEQGVNNMCRAVEEYAEERERIALEKAAEEMARTKTDFVDSLLKEGFPLEKALEMAKIDEETYNSHRIA